MSSKEQFKDALKRANQEIRDLKKELAQANIKNLNLHGRIKDLQDILRTYQPKLRTKKWYQFWK